MTFLQYDGLKPGDYHKSYMEWLAQSPYMEIGDDVLPDNIAFYVEGSELAATRLKLILNVNNPTNSDPSNERFTELSSKLVFKAAGATVEPAFFLKDEGKITQGDTIISISLEKWPANPKGRLLPSLGS